MKNYLIDKIEVCRNCQGKGFVFKANDYGGRGITYNEERCNVCEGRGSVHIIKRIEVEINPNEPYAKK